MLKDISLKKANLESSKKVPKQKKLENPKKAKDADIKLVLKKVNTRNVKPRKDVK